LLSPVSAVVPNSQRLGDFAPLREIGSAKPFTIQPMPEPLTTQQVKHVAKLARLRLNDAQIEQYRTQLSSILSYVAKLDELDLENVEPLAHPTELTNRLDDDVVAPSMPLENLLRNAPAVEDRYLAVPKVLEDTGG
jgi:aspartyl-tRNA(Asn)/glutamyl-tRNA(Gln) amidotransferase subunit C